MRLNKYSLSNKMSLIPSENTWPELAVRKIMYSLGYRFRIHDKRFNGSPDIYLAKYKTAIFVHGCFWHQHKNCTYSKIPKGNKNFWEKKLLGNVLRDKNIIKNLKTSGLNVGIIWECEVLDMGSRCILTQNVIKRIEKILYGRSHYKTSKQV